MIMVDTGVFLALFNKGDRHHAMAKRAFGSITEPMITTYPVITETCYLLTQFVNQVAERKFLRIIAQNAVVTFQIQLHHLERMVTLMEKYEDLPMDFADASLVVLAEQLGHGRILTVDRTDFNVYRWNTSQIFQNLLPDF
jgi:hypothetical protein